VIGDGRFNPYAMPARAWAVPVASTVAGSALALLPIVTSWALVPPLGLLMLLGWRLLRPEMWPAWIGLPLGLIDDILTGRPLGTGMALWTICLLAIDQIDARLIWRDHWQEWSIAAAALGFAIFGAVALGWIGGSAGSLYAMLPQYVAALLVFPAVLRLCGGLDRWRLRR
jgi:rod shape-determining protein MreD